MLSVKKLRQRPRHFVCFTGLTVEQFDQLLAELEPLYHQHQAQRLTRTHRQRQVGGGHPFHLCLADRLLATLLYLRLYLTGTLLGYLFDLDESSLSRERQLRMLPVLLEVLPVPLQDHLLSAVEHSADTEQGQGQGQKTRRKRIGTLNRHLERAAGTTPGVRGSLAGCHGTGSAQAPRPATAQTPLQRQT